MIKKGDGEEKVMGKKEDGEEERGKKREGQEKKRMEIERRLTRHGRRVCCCCAKKGKEQNAMNPFGSCLLSQPYHYQRDTDHNLI